LNLILVFCYLWYANFSVTLYTTQKSNDIVIDNDKSAPQNAPFSEYTLSIQLQLLETRELFMTSWARTPGTRNRYGALNSCFR